MVLRGITKRFPGVVANDAVDFAAGTGEELTPEILATVDAPITLLLGEQSPPSVHKAMYQLLRIVPRAQLLQMQDANHLAQVDEPQAFVRTVMAALERNRHNAPGK